MSKGVKILIVVVVVLIVLYFITKKTASATPQPTSLAGIWLSFKNAIGI
jgi:hypothetical protein